MVASDFVFPEAAALQVRAADESSSGGGNPAAATFPAGSTYSVSLPGGQAGRCLKEVSSSSDGTPVTLSAVKPEEEAQGDAIYCGPLQGAPLAPAAEAAAGSGSTGNSSTGSSSADAVQQQEQQPAPQTMEVRSGASCGRPGSLAALVAAALLAAALVAA